MRSDIRPIGSTAGSVPCSAVPSACTRESRRLRASRTRSRRRARPSGRCRSHHSVRPHRAAPSPEDHRGAGSVGSRPTVIVSAPISRTYSANPPDQIRSDAEAIAEREPEVRSKGRDPVHPRSLATWRTVRGQRRQLEVARISAPILDRSTPLLRIARSPAPAAIDCNVSSPLIHAGCAHRSLENPLWGRVQDWHTSSLLTSVSGGKHRYEHATVGRPYYCNAHTVTHTTLTVCRSLRRARRRCPYRVERS